MKAELRKLLGGKLSIPTLPAVVQRINTMMADPDVGTREVGELISEDGPLAAKVLKIANSAYYGLSRQCISTTHASTMLGMRVLKNIVTQVAVMGQFKHLEESTGINVTALWEHATLTAQMASKLCPLASNVRILGPEEFHVCGLLHDIGQVVMLDSLGQEYASVMLESMQTDMPIEILEQRAFGFDHQDVGALVCTRWELPEALIEAIQHHHQTRDQVGPRLHVLLVTTADQAAEYIQAKNMSKAMQVLMDAAPDLGVQQGQVASLLAQVESTGTGEEQEVA